MRRTVTWLHDPSWRIRTTPAVATFAVLGALTLPACAPDEEPVAPAFYSLTGHVVLVGYHVQADGQFAGTRVVSDADGVEVELVYGSQVVGRTTTQDGTYRFFGLAPGSYNTQARSGPVADPSAVLTITTADLVARDTLRLASFGDLYPVPNPLTESTIVHFTVPDTQDIDVRIRDVGGGTVIVLLARRVFPARHQVLWEGQDQANQPTPPGLYWVTFESGGDRRGQLLFKEP